MTNSHVELRSAVLSDAYTLWLWANDPAMRAAAFDRAEILWDEHLTWFKRSLDSSQVRIWIGQHGQLPVGCIRFDTRDDWSNARLSFVVAPEARGSGIGKRLVELGVEILLRDSPGAAVFAEVRANNRASLSVFRGLGWLEAYKDEGASRFVPADPRS